MVNYSDPLVVANLVATIALFTFLFDLADLRPQVGSFGFVWTGTYFVYLILRLLLSLGAAVLIIGAQPMQPPFLVGFVAVLGGAVVLQGFALKIAGQDVVNLANLIQTYKDKMVAEETRRAAEARRARNLDLSDTLVRTVPDEAELHREWHSVMFQVLVASGENDPAGRMRQLLDDIERRSADDATMKRRSFAEDIVATNPEYARSIVRRPRPTKTDPLVT